MIKINANTLMLIILALLLTAILVLQCVIVSRLRKNNSASNPFQLSSESSRNIQSQSGIISPPVSTSVQSDFFKRSIVHAESVIRGAVKADDYARTEKPGSDIIRAFLYLSESEKQSLLSAISYYQSDPFIFYETEKEFRKISAQTMIPLWIVILQDAMKKSDMSPLKKQEPFKVVSIAS